jgi:hypothetical protein
MPLALRLGGRLKVPALAASLGEVIRRHEVLRTVFSTGPEGEPRQTVLPAAPLGLPVVDLAGLQVPDRERQLGRLAAGEAARPFDLEHDLPLRAVLVRLGREEHALFVTLHHIASDGWSLSILVREIAALYQAAAMGERSPLPELPVQYSDYAVWQQRWLEGEALAAPLAYWRRQLAGAPAVLELPADFPRPEIQSFAGASRTESLPGELARGLHDLSRRQGTTLFMTLLAGFGLLLRRLTRSDDIVVGTDVANRTRAEVEPLVGFFVNQLVLRVDLAGDPTFVEVLSRVRRMALSAYAHQDLPFERLAEAQLRGGRSARHAPLFQVKLVLDNAPAARLEVPGLRFEPLRTPARAAQVDLMASFGATHEGLVSTFNYNTDLFREPTVALWMGQLAELLRQAVARPEARISELDAAIAEIERRHREQAAGRRRASRGGLRKARPVAVAAPISARDEEPPPGA